MDMFKYKYGDKNSIFGTKKKTAGSQRFLFYLRLSYFLSSKPYLRLNLATRPSD